MPVTETYDSFAHKGANQNWWLAQAKNGLIYNGTGTGLNEWDGEQWSIYMTPQKSRIRSLSIWKDEKIYVGTTNDIGFYQANDHGILTYYSLLDDWSFEDKQFGEIWSVASTSQGVVFLANEVVLFWDGTTIKLFDYKVGSHRLFSVDNQFYFKSNDDPNISILKIGSDFNIEKTGIVLEKNVVVRKMLRNRAGNLILITAKHGLFEVTNKQANQRLSNLDFVDETHIYNGIQARDGYYYLTSLYNGLFIVNEEFKLVKHYTQDHGMGTNTLLSVIEGFQGNIWISGAPHIIKMVPPHVYSHYKTHKNSTNSEWITSVDNTVTVLGDGINQLQVEENSIAPAYFKNVSSQHKSTWGAIKYENHLIYGGTDGVFAIAYDDKGQLATTENIIKTNFAKLFVIEPLTNTLFVSSDEGIFRIKYENNQWITQNIPDTSDELYSIAIENGILWAGTSTQELYRVENAQYDDKETIVTKYIDKDGLGANNVMPFNTSMGMVFGTNDGLMNFNQDRNPQFQFLSHLPKVFHTKNLDVFRLYEDEQNNLWYRIGNRTGYLYKDPQQQWQTNEDMFRYFPDSGYKGFVKSDENTLWFSMANGEIFRTNINRIKNIPKKVTLNIRKILNLNNQEEIYGGLGIAKLPELDQQNNSIRIYYALPDYSIANPVYSNKVRYRHRLIGSSHVDFSEWSHEGHKDFTLLRGHDYQFDVEAIDAWGRISRKSLNFTVLPPWYLSTMALIAYSIIGLLLLLLSSWLTQKWRTKKLKLRNQELENIVEERTADVQEKANDLKQQQEIKDRFFSNVSHEFRTPLTLTIAPLQAFLDDHKELDESFLHPVNTALRNSKKMLSLVSQVLDINRLESGRFPLHIARYNISETINNIVNRFTVLAKQQNQYLIAANTKEIHFLYFDQDQIDKCISNLVANAIKYSGKSSLIEVSLIEKDKIFGVKVSDNGKGISPEFEKKVFERYTQDEASKHIIEPGTGIGLSFVKELIELHDGKVELINKPNQGCAFILWMKKGHGHFDDSQLIEPVARKTENFRDEKNIIVEQKHDASEEIQSDDKTTIMVVDDNQELREFIVSRLSSYYEIVQASNGQEGFALAQSCLPDLIISDVMMPIMDGFELTKKLKSHNVTKSIPVILLTAQSSKRNTVTGLESGADDYITKPFDTSELILRVIRLINGIKLIRETIKTELSQSLTKINTRSSFTEKLQSEILEQISNPKLSVESLSSTLAMSRSSLNRRCKSELNKTTNQVIIDTRMQHALNLIKLNKHSITEIAYGTGFESLAYFSRIFKKHYGKTPSQVRKG